MELLLLEKFLKLNRVQSYILVITLFITFCLISCKKDYTCVCSNPSATNHDFYNILNEKKKVAEQKCKDYYNVTYANVPMNEISCEIKTK